MAKKLNRKIKFSGRDYLFIFIIIILLIALVFSLTLGQDILGLNTDDTQNVNTAANKIANYSLLSGNSTIILPEVFNTEKTMEAHFVDIGQGDAIVLRFPGGVDILIDAGSGTSVSTVAKEEYLSYLATLNLGNIEYLIATHPDSDHTNMLSAVIDTYQVDNIYYNGIENDISATYQTFTDKATAENGATVVAVDIGGDTYTIASEENGYTINLYAPGYERFSDVNSMSIICILEYGGRKVLFTGDAHTDEEEWLMAILGEESYDIDILKVGHHGSSSSTSEEFLNYFKPEYAIISVAETNSYIHPSPFTMNRLFDYGTVTYRTNRHGNIILYIDDDGDFAFLPENNVQIENNSRALDEKLLSI